MNESRYIYGNTVRKEDVSAAVNAPSRSYYIRRQRSAEKERIPYVRRVNLRYMVFLIAAMAVAGVILTGYITLRSRLLNGTKHIAALESELNSLRQENDEAWNRAQGGVDLEEIRRIAIVDYGMQYASDGQIINIETGGGHDYVRQNAEIP